MTIKHAIQAGTRGLRIYVLVFLLLFGGMFQWTFTDGWQEVETFLMMAVIIMALLVFQFVLAIGAFFALATKPTLLWRCLLLFFLTEISCFLMTGHFPFFGWITSGYSADPAEFAFMKARDFAFSISALLSCLVYFVFVFLRPGKIKWIP